MLRPANPCKVSNYLQSAQEHVSYSSSTSSTVARGARCVTAPSGAASEPVGCGAESTGAEAGAAAGAGAGAGAA
jgi:hypothetical protein